MGRQSHAELVLGFPVAVRRRHIKKIDAAINGGANEAMGRFPVHPHKHEPAKSHDRKACSWPVGTLRQGDRTLMACFVLRQEKTPGLTP